MNARHRSRVLPSAADGFLETEAGGGDSWSSLEVCCGRVSGCSGSACRARGLGGWGAASVAAPSC